MKKEYWKIAGQALLFGIIFFAAFGTVTVLIPNTFFVRMAPITMLDYILLGLTSLLSGLYASFHLHQKKHGNKKCAITAASGGVSGFLGFGCSVCNKVLVLLLGISGVLTYIEPYRPVIGFAGVGLLGYAVYAKGKGLNMPIWIDLQERHTD